MLESKYLLIVTSKGFVVNLGNCGMFEELGDNEIKELRKFSFEYFFKAGDTIFMEGESSKYLHILLEGSVELVKANSKFGEYHLHFIDVPVYDSGVVHV
jgi:CRP/FNR family transcriptional regulator